MEDKSGQLPREFAACIPVCFELSHWVRQRTLGDGNTEQRTETLKGVLTPRLMPFFR